MHSLATSGLWLSTIIGFLALFLGDFAITRRPHEVSLREAAGWSAFYIALPVLFGGWLWWSHGQHAGAEFFTGYVVEKSLSVDNLFVFMLLLSAFTVPHALRQRVLLLGVAGALGLRAVMIALGAQLLTRFEWTFLIFGLVLVATALKVFRDTVTGDEPEVDPSSMRVVRLLRRVFPVTDGYRGTAMVVRENETPAGESAQGRSRTATRLALTPLAVVTFAVLATDALFAVDSVPAVYGITGDPYLVFVTNAFALLGLRALYFLVTGVLGRLVHLGYGLAVILAFIGYKLVAHWAHGLCPSVPVPSTGISLGVIALALGAVTVTSLVATRRKA